MAKRQTTIQLSEEMFAKIEKESNEFGLSISDVVGLRLQGLNITKMKKRLVSEIEVLSDVIERAVDVWGLEYAYLSEGYDPLGNQIGRRALCAADFGLYNWNFRISSIANENKIIDCEINTDSFLILLGIRVPRKFYLELLNSIEGFMLRLCGCSMPLIPFCGWKEDGDWYVYDFSSPISTSPTTGFVVTVLSNMEEDKEVFIEFFGEVIAKRSYLIKPPQKLIEDAMVREEVSKRCDLKILRQFRD